LLLYVRWGTFISHLKLLLLRTNYPTDSTLLMILISHCTATSKSSRRSDLYSYMNSCYLGYVIKSVRLFIPSLSRSRMTLKAVLILVSLCISSILQSINNILMNGLIFSTRVCLTYFSIEFMRLSENAISLLMMLK
jgi:hypothetical protein